MVCKMQRKPKGEQSDNVIGKMHSNDRKKDIREMAHGTHEKTIGGRALRNIHYHHLDNYQKRRTNLFSHRVPHCNQ